MQQPWTGIVNIGIVHAMIYPETLRGEGTILETATKIAADEFFGAFEVSWIKDPNTLSKVAKLLETTSMDIVYCGGPSILIQKLDINSLDEAVRSAAIEGVKKLVDEAYVLGARILVVASGPDVASDKREKAEAALVKSLKEICRYAGEKSKGYTMMISLENFDKEYDKKLLIGPTAESAKVVAEVKEECDNIGLTVDLSHLPLLHETTKEALKAAKQYLEHVHIGNCVMKDKNNPLYGDQHPRFDTAGGENSVEELAEFLRVLKEIGYFNKKAATRLPVISFEVRPAPGESSEVVMASSKRVFAEAWSKI